MSDTAWVVINQQNEVIGVTMSYHAVNSFMHNVGEATGKNVTAKIVPIIDDFYLASNTKQLRALYKLIVLYNGLYYYERVHPDIDFIQAVQSVGDIITYHNDQYKCLESKSYHYDLDKMDIIDKVKEVYKKSFNTESPDLILRRRSDLELSQLKQKIDQLQKEYDNGVMRSLS